MTAWNPRANDLFDRASEIESPAERVAYVQRECQGDGELRREVDALLRAHETQANILDGTACDLMRPASPLSPGAVIGRYRLMERIGEGGFADVYRAEQTEPVRREVAIKVIKPGMDSRQVIARFEAERQALAMMDHPNIAKIYDAGATDIGRPYFVMELICGVPITQYCDTSANTTGLPITGRLELYLDVCCAVQHAHQKGIIHRDLKPSNILVAHRSWISQSRSCPLRPHSERAKTGDAGPTTPDAGRVGYAPERPTVRIIDFGIAKATQQRLTEHTPATETGQLLGTPEYMSPEQATFQDADVDTCSDIYSLGVLLYELLTGTTPFEAADLRRLGYDEVCRTIREEEPIPPSKRLAQLRVHDSPFCIPPSAIDQDLDWIVMKALEKDRNRRYETAGGLAEDVRRYLNDEPVLIGPPSGVYRARKFVRRHRGLVASVTAIAMLLVAGVMGTSYGLVQSWQRQAELDDTNRRLLATQRQLLEALQDETLMAAMSGDFVETARLIEKAHMVGASGRWSLRMQGLTALYGGQSQKAIGMLEKAVRQDPECVAAHSMLTSGYLYSGDFDAHQRSMLRLRKLGAKTLEDVLFKAQTERTPRLAIETVNQVLAERPRWELALAIRGQANAHLALDTGQSQHAWQAVEDVERAMDRLEDNPFLLATALFSYQVALQFCERDGMSSNRFRTAADKVADKLGRFPDYILGRMIRAWYFDATGDLDAAIKQLQAACEGGNASDLFLACYAGVLYRQGQFERGVAVLNGRPKPRGTQTEVARAYFLMDLPGGRGNAESIFADLHQQELPPYSQLNVLTIPLLLGEVNRVEQASAEILHSSEERIWAGREAVEFLAGELSGDDLVAKAEASKSRLQVAYWLIGLKHVGRGHRDQAKKYLAACINTGYFYTGICHWAKAFLARLNRDADWPTAIHRIDQTP